MAKLKKREIIILAIAGLSILLYVAYVFLFANRLPGKKVENTVESSKIESFKSSLTDELNKNKLSDLDNYIIKRSQIDWIKNPFLKRELYRAWLAKDGGGGPSVKIIYSGYVDSSKKKMAVLNGIEYRIGEELKEEGYILKNITPSKVTIFDKRTGSNLEIPIQE